MAQAREPLNLELKLNGPLVDNHRLPLTELLRVGKQLRDSLRDVAVVLTHHGPSGSAGRVKKAIEESVDLRVIGGPTKGSFVLALETPTPRQGEQDTLPADIGPDLAERAVQTFLEGLEVLDAPSDRLPEGFDRGVLRALSPFRTTFRKGLDEILLTATQDGQVIESQITLARVESAQRLVKKPFKASAVAEGILQMVDFGSLECRVDRPELPGITIYFDESDRDPVQEAVRQHVRVVGEGQFEPDQTEPTKIWASSIDIVHEALALDLQAFWTRESIGEIAKGTPRYSATGEAEDPWRDDDEAAALIEAIRSSR